MAGKKKLTYEYVKDQIEKEGYQLLSNEYVNSSTKLKLRCPEGHEYEVIWNNFRHGNRCPYCAGKKKHSYEYIKDQIEKYRYQLLSKSYINAHTKLKIKCSKGHEYEVIWNNFKKGKRCPYCFGNNKLKYGYVKDQIEKEGYYLLSKYYVNAKTKLKLMCDKGHEYESDYDHFNSGCRCPKCDYEKTSSKPEKEICNFLKTRKINIIENDRSRIINPLTDKYLELDVFIPELNKAIEFNGEFWHSGNYSKYKDKIKKQQCEENGIELLVIEERDWINNKEQCLNKINEFIK